MQLAVTTDPTAVAGAAFQQLAGAYQTLADVIGPATGMADLAGLTGSAAQAMQAVELLGTLGDDRHALDAIDDIQAGVGHIQTAIDMPDELRTAMNVREPVMRALARFGFAGETLAEGFGLEV